MSHRPQASVCTQQRMHHTCSLPAVLAGGQPACVRQHCWALQYLHRCAQWVPATRPFNAPSEACLNLAAHARSSSAHGSCATALPHGMKRLVPSVACVNQLLHVMLQHLAIRCGMLARQRTGEASSTCARSSLQSPPRRHTGTHPRLSRHYRGMSTHWPPRRLHTASVAISTKQHTCQPQPCSHQHRGLTCSQALLPGRRTCSSNPLPRFPQDTVLFAGHSGTLAGCCSLLVNQQHTASQPDLLHGTPKMAAGTCKL